MCQAGTAVQCPGGFCNEPTGDCTIIPDADLDGVPNSSDNCPLVANSGQGDGDDDHIGDPCDNAPTVFNSDQSITNDVGIADVLDPNTPKAFVLTRVYAKTRTRAGGGSLLVQGTYDTTEIGGYLGLLKALHRGFAFGFEGVGESTWQGLFFPPCLSGIGCPGPNGATVSFTRKGATNLFRVRFSAGGILFPEPFVAAGVGAVLSLGDLDRRDDIGNCKVHGNHTQTLLCK
jgi:hypothetical protein